MARSTPAQPPHPDPWEHFEEATKAFRLLYQAITGEMRKYANTLDSDEETHWFDGLVDAFDEAFESWKHLGRLRRCLESIDQASPHAFRVTAYAYIHIAYDLPRCLASCLDPPDRPRGRAVRNSYLRAQDVLDDVFRAECVNREVFGWYAYLFRIWLHIPVLKSIAFETWAARVRERSFIVAQELYFSPKREADQAELWRNVERNIRQAEKTRNPFEWLTILKPPDVPGLGPDSLDVIPYVRDAWVDYSEDPIGEPDGPREER